MAWKKITADDVDAKIKMSGKKSGVEWFVMGLRLLLTAAMIAGIYGETGPCTAIFAGAVAMSIELQSKILSNITKILRGFGP